jgi:hypothetical protein
MKRESPMKKEDRRESLRADPIDWLLEEGDPGVRYLTLRDIVDADERETEAARRKADCGNNEQYERSRLLDKPRPYICAKMPGHVVVNHLARANGRVY